MCYNGPVPSEVTNVPRTPFFQQSLVQACMQPTKKSLEDVAFLNRPGESNFSLQAAAHIGTWLVRGGKKKKSTTGVQG